jgi:hypothetical protein
MDNINGMTYFKGGTNSQEMWVKLIVYAWSPSPESNDPVGKIILNVKIRKVEMF